MNLVKTALRYTFRTILAIAAVTNLFMCFILNYRIPSGMQKMFAWTGLEMFQSETKEVDTASLVRLIVPSQALNYNGGDLDLLSGIYIQYPDGTRVEDAEIETSIEEGNTRLDKIVHYTTVLEDGTELTGQRAIRIAGRYTGPSLIVTGEIPELTPEDDISAMIREQVDLGYIYAEDGFGNDITGDVKGRFDKSKNEEGEEVVRLVLYVVNAVGDSTEMNVSDEMTTTGVVTKLTTEELTLNIGTPFYYQDYVKECRDSHGNALSPQVIGIVNSYVYGDYEIEIFCVDENGVSSPHRTLKVHIV